MVHRKAFVKAFIKPFKAAQRSAKIKFQINFHSSSRTVTPTVKRKPFVKIRERRSKIFSQKLWFTSLGIVLYINGSLEVASLMIDWLIINCLSKSIHFSIHQGFEASKSFNQWERWTKISRFWISSREIGANKNIFKWSGYTLVQTSWCIVRINRI